jgi:excisionase family DNA binding protein
MATTKQLLSPQEARELIGVGLSTMNRMLREGQIASIRIGRLRKVPLDAIQRFIDRHLTEQDRVQGG